MTINKLASMIAKLEGKKSQVKIGDLRETLGILSDVVFEHGIEIYGVLFANGVKRAKKKEKKNATTK